MNTLLIALVPLTVLGYIESKTIEDISPISASRTWKKNGFTNLSYNALKDILIINLIYGTSSSIIIGLFVILIYGSLDIAILASMTLWMSVLIIGLIVWSQSEFS